MNLVYMPMDYYVWGAMLEGLSEIHATADQQLPSWDCFVDDIERVAAKSSLILRHSYHFTTDFDRVLLELVDILKHCLNTKVRFLEKPDLSELKAAGSLKCLNRRWKAGQFDLLLVNVQCLTACSVEKLNFKV